jgi:hypothetical protein
MKIFDFKFMLIMSILTVKGIFFIDRLFNPGKAGWVKVKKQLH